MQFSRFEVQLRLAALCAAIGFVSCSDVTRESAQSAGLLRLALSGTSTSGIHYRLRHGRLTIQGACSVLVSTEEFLQAESIDVQLNAGDYALALEPGWNLEVSTPDAGFVTVQAALTSANPQPFTIEDGKRSYASLRFRVGDHEIGLAEGELMIRIDVDDSPPTAGDAGGTDGMGDGAPTTGGASSDGEPAGCSTSVVTEISAGFCYACARLSDGTIRCWGINRFGALGDGTTIDRALPVTVVGITNAIALATGQEHSCALLGDGSVWCWGYKTLGVFDSVPVKMPGIVDATAIAIADYQACVLLKNGSIQCWNTYDDNPPYTVPTVAKAIAISAGGAGGICAVFSGGSVGCWGERIFGEIDIATPSLVPVAVPDVSGATTISTGDQYACALLSDGSIRCWGRNDQGQLGNGTMTDNWDVVPVTVSGITDATAVSCGGYHSCALLNGGSIRCWGWLDDGNFGEPPTYGSIPTAIPGITDAIAVSASMVNSCALLRGGGVRCWGDNYYGQLGDGTTTDSFVPVTVRGLSCP